LHAALAAHTDHRIAPIECVLHHVDSELPRGPDDANLHHVRQAYSWVSVGVSNGGPAFTLSRLSTELLSRDVKWRSTSTRGPLANPRLFGEDNRLNVYADELEVRPPGAPTTGPVLGTARPSVAPWRLSLPCAPWR